ncbi:MAG: hypothetical protein LBR98_06325 [Syntrophomonadaceae bacterium]|jgi:hypothetical protein|nr:hypothetical protein [Syntrophomonadaceae bacterium]
MDIGLYGIILAIVTTAEADRIYGGACPIFTAYEDKEKNELSFKLARILGGAVHDLGNGVHIICRHH